MGRAVPRGVRIPAMKQILFGEALVLVVLAGIVWDWPAWLIVTAIAATVAVSAWVGRRRTADDAAHLGPGSGA